MTPDELRTARKSKPYTQAELAAAIGYSRQAIIKWENKSHPIPDDVAAKVLAACVGEPAKPKATKFDRDVLLTYGEMRGIPNNCSHAEIMAFWHRKNFMPSTVAQQMIAEAFPDILKPSES